MHSEIDQTVGDPNDELFKASMTCIEYHVDKRERAECENMERIMRRLDAVRSPDRSLPDRDTSPLHSYKVSKPPYFVLNILETEGYKVVGTNTMISILVWTLHRQPQPQA